MVDSDLLLGLKQLKKLKSATLKLKNGQIKKKAFRVTGLKTLGRVGRHIFFNYFFPEKYIILCILKGISPFQNACNLFFPENMNKILGFTSKFR